MPIALTRAGLVAERVTQAFWPLWTVLFVVLVPLVLGWQDFVPLEAIWAYAAAALVALGWALVRGLRALRWPSEAEAIARVDARLPGRPLAALKDVQAVGSGDPASEAVWRVHLARMQESALAARAVEPDLRVSARDPYGLRYMTLLSLIVALLFGSFWRVGTITEVAAGPAGIVASGPVWEGWIEPPAYTGKPTLYLADLALPRVQVPVGSSITLRLYDETGALTVTETVSGRAPDAEAEGAGAEVADAEPVQQQSFEVTQTGRLTIEGGDATALWDISVIEDAPPSVQITDLMDVDARGKLSQPFAAQDDYGVMAGTAVIALDQAAIDRRHGLATDPDPRDPIVVDLPMPFSGGRADFSEALIDDFSEHPWANLPVTMMLQVEDALGQTGETELQQMILPGRRFFQPIARAVIEQRRDIMWSKANAPRAAQILRAVSNRPDDFFPNETTYLRLRFTIRQLENTAVEGGLTDEVQAEVVEALWELAVQLEEGALADARARLERAQDRLAEAMRNGASDEEIAELMNELREAMNDYMNMLAQQMDRSEDGTDQPDRNAESNRITQDELQALMDRIQELMEEGRMAEAMDLMEQLNELMENLRMTQGEGGEGGPRTPGQQSMEDLAETLRDQQDLNDQAFRDLQEQFNQGQQDGQQQGEQGQDGQQGQEGQDGQQGQNDGQQGQDQGQQQGDGLGQGGNTQGGTDDQNGQAGEGGGMEQSLADRQQALRDGLNQLRNALPRLSGDAADNAERSLERAEGAMEGAEDALRDGDLAEAIDRQSEAMEALREGLRNLGQALAENQTDELEQQGQGARSGSAEARPEPQRRDPLGRQIGNTGQFGTDENMLQDDINRRAEELLKDLRDRSADQQRPQLELDYLRRLLDRF